MLCQQDSPKLHRGWNGSLLLQPRQAGGQPSLLVHRSLSGRHRVVRDRTDQVQGGKQHHQTLDSRRFQSEVRVEKDRIKSIAAFVKRQTWPAFNNSF